MTGLTLSLLATTVSFTIVYLHVLRYEVDLLLTMHLPLSVLLITSLLYIVQLVLAVRVLRKFNT